MLSTQAFSTRLIAVFPRTYTPLAAVRAFASLSTTSLSPLTVSSVTLPPLRIAQRPFTSKTIITSSCLRHVSTTTSPPSSAASPSSPNYAAAASTNLTWNEFFRLRKNRRFYNFFASISTSIVSLTGGMVLLSQQNLQALAQSMFGLDPMVVMGLWALGFFGGGWLAGPLVGTSVWGMVHGKVRGAMGVKERDFFERVRRYRVDPTSSSMQNPVPDYYGEKITSVQGYRQWLKDQRAFNKKREKFL